MVRYASFFALLLAVLTTGCETIIDVELPEHEPRLVVNSLFEADSLWHVEVGRSQGIRETDLLLECVTDATVELLREGRVLGTLSYADEAPCLSAAYRNPDLRVEPGAQYTVRVTAPGFEPAEATGRTPEAVPFTLGERLIRDENYRPLEATISLEDDGAAANYYALSVFVRSLQIRYNPRTEERDTSYVRRRASFFSSDPVLRENEDFAEAVEGDETRYRRALFSDATFNGKTERLTIRAPANYSVPLSDEDSFEVRHFVVLTALTREAYEYLRTEAVAERAGDNPFAEPVQVFSNVENGLGIFAGMASFERPITTEVEEQPCCFYTRPAPAGAER